LRDAFNSAKHQLQRLHGDRYRQPPLPARSIL
jgi:hypothetical protein